MGPDTRMGGAGGHCPMGQQPSRDIERSCKCEKTWNRPNAQSGKLGGGTLELLKTKKGPSLRGHEAPYRDDHQDTPSNIKKR